MKLLLHICCAPCTIYPLKILRQAGHELTGYFYNPNIHPYLEYKRRLDTLKEFSLQEALPVEYDETYPMESFLRAVASDEMNRCRHCYAMRLQRAAREAKEGGYEGFTTTLLYSKYQKHDWIREAGEEAAARHGLTFLYVDFRDGWSEGVERSKELGMYRQPYCGCIYSEKERYFKPKKTMVQSPA